MEQDAPSALRVVVAPPAYQANAAFGAAIFIAAEKSRQFPVVAVNDEEVTVTSTTFTIADVVRLSLSSHEVESGEC